MNRPHLVLVPPRRPLTPTNAEDDSPDHWPDQWGEPASTNVSGCSSQTLDALREEFPLLAGACSDRGLSAAQARRDIDDRTRLLTRVAMSAALGNRDRVKADAGRALDLGARQEELKEIVYLTAAHAGLRRAIDAASTLSELFAERWEASLPIN